MFHNRITHLNAVINSNLVSALVFASSVIPHKSRMSVINGKRRPGKHVGRHFTIANTLSVLTDIVDFLVHHNELFDTKHQSDDEVKR